MLNTEEIFKKFFKSIRFINNVFIIELILKIKNIK